jgi:hypothetical protein
LNQRDTAISGARTTALFPVIAVSQTQADKIRRGLSTAQLARQRSFRR